MTEKMDSSQKPIIAMVAHDGKKADMVAFAKDHKDLLEQCIIIATGTTGQLLIDKAGLKVERLLSGPIGGDAQIAARVAQHEVAAVFFFLDPLGKHPHDPDIQMLLRICNVHDIPLATNPATASAIVKAMTLHGKSLF